MKSLVSDPFLVLRPVRALSCASVVLTYKLFGFQNRSIQSRVIRWFEDFALIVAHQR